jgi:hypothetical protein
MHVPSLPVSRLLPDYRDAVSFSHLDLHVTRKIFPSPQPRAHQAGELRKLARACMQSICLGGSLTDAFEAAFV